MKEFKKYYIIPASPEEVYAALTNEATIRLWTGDEVEMTAIVGSEFSMWDGSIVGRIMELVPGKKIVQQWYFEDDHHTIPSLVTFKLHADKKGTSLEVRHTNIPEEAYEDIVEGWDVTYMADLIDFYMDEE